MMISTMCLFDTTGMRGFDKQYISRVSRQKLPLHPQDLLLWNLYQFRLVEQQQPGQKIHTEYGLISLQIFCKTYKTSLDYHPGSASEMTEHHGSNEHNEW